MNKLNKCAIFFTIVTCSIVQHTATITHSSMSTEMEPLDKFFRSSKIIFAPVNAFPYYARLVRSSNNKRSKFLCAGTIVNRKWILTAAACLEKNSKINITLGISSYDKDNFVYHYAKQQIIHPDFKANSTDHQSSDIGLIETGNLIVFNAYVFPIPLPSYNVLLKNYPVAAIEYGKIYDKTKMVRYQCLRLLDQADCAAARTIHDKLPITKKHICIKGAVEESLCQIEDIGSPLIADGVQIGIGTIFGVNGACTLKHPYIYTRVWTFYNWITDYINAPFSVRDPDLDKSKRCDIETYDSFE